MDDASLILLGTAASIGFGHTLVGVDHSLPFVVLARSQQWSLKKTWAVTGLCGVAHVGSSVLIGSVMPCPSGRPLYPPPFQITD